MEQGICQYNLKHCTGVCMEYMRTMRLGWGNWPSSGFQHNIKQMDSMEATCLQVGQVGLFIQLVH
jgi:hypothetical protein